jgi:hypothetical protein
MADQDGVRLVGVERAVALPADLDVLQRAAALRGVARQFEDLLLDHEVLRRGGIGSDHARHHHSQDAQRAHDLVLHRPVLPLSGRRAALCRMRADFVAH